MSSIIIPVFRKEIDKVTKDEQKILTEWINGSYECLAYEVGRWEKTARVNIDHGGPATIQSQLITIERGTFHQFSG